MLLFMFLSSFVLMKVTHYILSLSISYSKSYLLNLVSTIFFKLISEQKFITLYLNEICLCPLLCFLSVLRCLNKACVNFFCVKYLSQKNKTKQNCPDNLNIYTTFLEGTFQIF